MNLIDRLINRYLRKWFIILAVSIFLIVIFLITEYLKFFIFAGMFFLVFKLIHNDTFKSEKNKNQNSSRYIFLNLDSTGKPMANWLFRNSSYPYQFSLKCPFCTEIFYASTPVGNAICRNGHFAYFQISEALFSDSFNLIDENKDYVNQVYLESMFEVLGYLSKGDGRVSKEEISYTIFLMNKFIDIENDKIYEEALQNSFRRGKNSKEYFENVLLLKFLLKDDQKARVNLINAMIELAIVDGELEETEKNAIRNVCRAFGDISEHILNETFFKYERQKSSQVNSTLKSIDDCFLILESKKTDSRETLKRNYYRLSKKYHPDQFVGNENALKMAEEKMKKINIAWETIKRSFEENT